MDIKKQVNDVSIIMHDNINKILAREETINSLETKSNKLLKSSDTFIKKSKSISCLSTFDYIFIVVVLGIILK